MPSDGPERRVGESRSGYKDGVGRPHETSSKAGDRKGKGWSRGGTSILLRRNPQHATTNPSQADRASIHPLPQFAKDLHTCRNPQPLPNQGNNRSAPQSDAFSECRGRKNKLCPERQDTGYPDGSGRRRHLPTLLLVQQLAPCVAVRGLAVCYPPRRTTRGSKKSAFQGGPTSPNTLD